MIYRLLIVLWICVTVISCQPKKAAPKDSIVDQVSENIQDEKKEIVLELEALKSDIQNRLNDLDAKIVKATEAEKTGLEKVKSDLNKKMDDIDFALKEVQNATEKTWYNTKDYAEEKAEDVEVALNKMSDAVAEVFE